MNVYNSSIIHRIKKVHSKDFGWTLGTWKAEYDFTNWVYSHSAITLLSIVELFVQ